MILIESIELVAALSRYWYRKDLLKSARLSHGNVIIILLQPHRKQIMNILSVRVMTADCSCY